MRGISSLSGRVLANPNKGTNMFKFQLILIKLRNEFKKFLGIERDYSELTDSEIRDLES